MMSGLVSYESSSEDEAVSTSETSKPTLANTHASKDPVNGFPSFASTPVKPENKKIADDENVPLIGPTIPDTFEDYEDRHDPDIEQPTMSERDQIRYLTQTNHPMTSIPPSPPGTPNPITEAKFKRFLDLKTRGIHFNEDLAGKNSFQNPSLLSTMMVNAGVEEAQYNSSIPSSLWNPGSFPSFAYKEELLKSQQSIRDQEAASRRAQSAAGKRKIEFAVGTNSSSSSRHSTPGLQPKR